MGKYAISICQIARDWHKKNSRYYAHVGHKNGKICVTDQFWKLPWNFKIAILLHEIGHLLSPGKSEKVVNKTIEELLDIKIHYIPKTQFGNNLEWVNPEDGKIGYKFLSTFLDQKSMRRLRPFAGIYSPRS